MIVIKTAIYLRKSRAEELSDTIEETLQRHKDTLIEFAKKSNLNIVEIYEEVVSGENLYMRVEMLRLLNDVENEHYDSVLCMDIDRLGRGAMSQQGIILETFKNANCKIITPRKVYDLNNEIDEEYTEFQTFFARRELKTINRRMRQGINKTIADGGYISNAPYGYEKCRVGKLPSLKVLPDEAKFVRMIFNLYTNKNIGGQTIADTLNAMGATPKRGAKFNRSTVMNIIRNNVYIGKITWNKMKHTKPKTLDGKATHTLNAPELWITVDGIHDSIIDNTTFLNAQDILTGRYHVPYNTGVLKNPLAGLIICSNCNSKMQYRPFIDGNFAHMICTNKGCIKGTQFRFVEPAVIKAIEEQLENLKVNCKSHDNENITEFEDALKSLEKEILLSIGQRNKLHDLLEQGVYDVDTFVTRNSVIDTKLAQINSTKSSLEIKIASLKKRNINSVIARIENVLTRYDLADAGERNQLLKSIITSVVYMKEQSWKQSEFALKVNYLDI